MAALMETLRDKAQSTFGKLKTDLLIVDDDGCNCDYRDCSDCYPDEECDCGDYDCGECYPDGHPSDCECYECWHDNAETCDERRQCRDDYGCRPCDRWLDQHFGDQHTYQEHCEECYCGDRCNCCSCNPCDELGCDICHGSGCECSQCYQPCEVCGENAVTDDRDLIIAQRWEAGEWERIEVCVDCLPGTCHECERFHEGECPPRLSDISLQGQMILEDAA